MTLDLILIALAISLEPIPLTGFILVLSSEGGIGKGLGFLLGWVTSLSAIVIVSMVATGGKPVRTGSAPSTAGLTVRMAVGAGLLGVAWWYARRRDPDKPKTTPKWMGSIDRMGFVGAAFLAFLLQPWGLVIAGVATVVQADLSSAGDVAGLVLFVVLATATYLGMEIYALSSPERARQGLGNLRTWIDNHKDVIIIWISVLIGLYLIVKSAYLLASA